MRRHTIFQTLTSKFNAIAIRIQIGLYLGVNRIGMLRKIWAL